MIHSSTLRQRSWTTTLLHLDSSSRIDGSRSREVAATFSDSWRRHHRSGQVDYRDLAAQPLPHLIDAVLASAVPELDRTDAHVAALARQDQVVDQFVADDEYLISVPMYNFGIPPSSRPTSTTCSSSVAC